MDGDEEFTGTTGVVDRIASMSDRETVAVDDVVAAFGPTAFLPILIVPAILVVSPLSGVPFFSSICGLSIALVAGQTVLGRRELWLPRVILRKKISGKRLGGGADRVRGLARWLDRRTRDRLSFLVGRTQRPVLFAACAVCGLTMPVLEVVPFSSSVLGMAVLCFSTALLARDGLFALAGYTLMGLASMIPISVYFGLS